jgi:hypothetical protein
MGALRPLVYINAKVTPARWRSCAVTGMCQRRPPGGPPRAGSSRHDGANRHASVRRSSPAGKLQQLLSVVRLWRAPASQIPTAQLVQRCHQLGLAADPGVVLRDHPGPRAGALFIRLLDLDPVEPPGAGQPVACAVAVVADVEPRHRRAHRGRDTSASLSVEPVLGSRPGDRRPGALFLCAVGGLTARRKTGEVSAIVDGQAGSPAPCLRPENSAAEASRHVSGSRTGPGSACICPRRKPKSAPARPFSGFSPPDCCGSPWLPATR